MWIWRPQRIRTSSSPRRRLSLQAAVPFSLFPSPPPRLRPKPPKSRGANKSFSKTNPQSPTISPPPPMGKRPPVVVLSSSSGEDDGGGRRGPSARRSRTPASAPARAQSQAASGSRKKPRRESSAGRGRRRCSEPAASDSLKVIKLDLEFGWDSIHISPFYFSSKKQMQPWFYFNVL